MQLPVSDWFLVLLHGSRLDISITGYIMVIPALVIISSSYSKGKFLTRFINTYTIILLLISSFVIISDMELYRHWGFRMDATPLLYLANPKEIAGSADFLATVIQTIIWMLIMVVSLVAYFKFIRRKLRDIKKANWKVSLVFLFVLSTLILPVRGSLGIAPMNVGFVYFHKSNVFANHAAINVLWNVGHALTKLNKTKQVKFYEEDKAKKIFRELYVDNGNTEILLNCNKPNILIMILESYTAKIIEPLGGLQGITPNFTNLCKEGILFSNFYSSGDRTDKGVLSILNGYPAQPITSIIKFAKKTEHLPYLNQDLKQIGYNTQFVYGYDINYANFNSYFSIARFDDIVDKDDFPAGTQTSKWGVHDHIVFDKLFDECNKSKMPFFKTLMSQSSHEPFTVPMETVIEGGDEESRFLNSAYYTDKCIGDFIEKAKQTDWWEKTLIIFVADHGARHPENTPSFKIKKFHIPMLWVGGALAKRDTIIETFSGHTDIPLTILKQLGSENKNYKFSQNIISSEAPSFAFYDFNNGFGFVTEEVKLIFDIVSSKYILTEGLQNNEDLEIPKAYMQTLSEDFTDK
jgi:phosphoglycerol transferase MdoB-like AlkP superfamily enzyme